jgi:small subunit ribosomal protein S19
MSRSNWKGPNININLRSVKSFQKLKEISTHENILKANRNSEIVPKFVGLTFRVHNGKKDIDVLVIERMVGHKFGEFCPTRARFSFKKKKAKK